MVKMADFALSRFRTITSSSSSPNNSEKRSSTSLPYLASKNSQVTPMSLAVSHGPNMASDLHINDNTTTTTNTFASTTNPPVMRVSPFSPYTRSRSKSVHASAYIAPETYSGSAQCTPQMDIYRYDNHNKKVRTNYGSLGIILWEMLTRVMTGKYERPFAEYSALKFDFQV